MSIRVGKYNYQTRVQPITEGFTNILVHTSGPLSPYVMKDDNGVIMENYWQFSKYWASISSIKTPVSRYNVKETRWEHGDEIHYKEGELTPEYWNWRAKGFSHPMWVRYPNGYKRHHEAIGSVIGTPENHEFLTYIEARKRIYLDKYREIATKTDLFKELRERLNNGENLQINEVDGPAFANEYPYNQVVNSSIEISKEILEALINNPKQPFGHGYSLAASLLGIEL